MKYFIKDGRSKICKTNHINRARRFIHGTTYHIRYGRHGIKEFENTHPLKLNLETK